MPVLFTKISELFVEQEPEEHQRLYLATAYKSVWTNAATAIPNNCYTPHMARVAPSRKPDHCRPESMTIDDVSAGFQVLPLLARIGREDTRQEDGRHWGFHRDSIVVWLKNGVLPKQHGEPTDHA